MSLSNNHVNHTHPTCTPSRTVVTSFTPRRRSSTPIAHHDDDTNRIHQVSTDTHSAYDDGDWVLCLASSSSSSSSTLSCALSNGSVQAYDQSSLLPLVSYLPRSTNNYLVTDMKYGPMDTSILTTGNDGSFVVKDLRQPSDIIAQSMNICTARNSHNESLLSLALGYDGFIVALASSKGCVHFIDVRTMTSELNTTSLLGSYVNSHRDAVTQVAFHSERTSLLMSAGEDGLICTYDTTKATEDLAIETVINTGMPCRKAGFCCDNFIFCLSGSETASLWDCHTAVCANDFGNFSLRDTLGRMAALPINYLVDAKWDPFTHELLLCAGNHEGNTAIFKYDVNGPGRFWEVNELLMSGHHGIIRAWCPATTTISSQADNGSTNAVFFTAGEDARICEWSHEALPIPPNSTDVSMFEPETSISTNRAGTTNRVGGPIRRQRRSSQTLAKPY